MNARILGAFIVGAGLISVSLFSASKEVNSAPQAAVVVAEAPERNYIAIADENNNGIPDWREQLKTVQTLSLGTSTNLTATYTPPDTLTGQMAIQLFKQTVQAKQYGTFTEDQDQMIENFEAQMLQAAVDTLYTFADIEISDIHTTEALHAYGNKVAEIALIHGVAVDTENEALITKQAVASNNPEELTKLTPIKVSYENMRDDMLTLSVPENLANEHLLIVNAYNAMAINIAAMENSFTDPLYTMTRMKRYQDDTKGLYYGLLNMYTTIVNSGVQYEPADLARQVFGFLNIW